LPVPPGATREQVALGKKIFHIPTKSLKKLSSNNTRRTDSKQAQVLAMLHGKQGAKHFRTIDDLRKRTFARRGAIRSGDLEQAENCNRVIFCPCGFLEMGFRVVGSYPKSR
jgi:hypothetical protein